jgi:opacity protein-like surface antigen
MKRSLLALLFVLGTSTTAFAQIGELFLSFGQGTTRNKSLGDFSAQVGAPFQLEQKGGFRFAVRFAINNEGYFGHEFGYAYNRGKVEESTSGLEQFGMSMHQGMYNFLLYGTREGTRIRPFATGGVHFTSFYPPGSSVYSGNSITKFGFNYGAGVKARVSNLFSVRADIRDYWQGKPDLGAPTGPSGMLKILEVSAGLGIVF